MPRPVALLAGVVLALAVAGCGDDDEGERPAAGGAGSAAETTAGTETDDTGTAPGETAPRQEAGTDGGEAEGGGSRAPGGSPEDQPGGAGDEVPASSLALIVGRRGGYHPTVVHVPPFIAIRVQLRSSDGVEYELSGDGRTLKAGGEIPSVSTTFDGLRAGERLVLSGPQGRVSIEANAEPGP